MKKKGYAKRSDRKVASSYKKGDYVEFQLNGRTVTGCLIRKNARGWVVQPSDRRRREETFSEENLGRVIDEEEAKNNKGAIRTIKRQQTKETTSSSNSVGSGGNGSYSESNNNYSPTTTATMTREESSLSAKKRKNGRRGSYSEDGVTANNDYSEYETTSARGYEKRKSEITTESERPKYHLHQQHRQQQQLKSVTFTKDTKVKKVGGSRIGTRSKTRNSSEELIPVSLPLKQTKMKKNKYRKSASSKKGVFPEKKATKDESVTVVKMFTGTLYLYRGERPRAEFVRSK
mmetsp:Transcript_23836/g.47765  ORF Transcript_23836/g.47765 Transcript_23836/m.47765 type:complete len:289 (+) Transcript_23836:1-867(+)